MTKDEKQPAASTKQAQPPQWGFAEVCRNDEGKLYWRCTVDAEEGVTESPTIELAADTFAEGTIVRIYEPIKRRGRVVEG